MFILSGNTDAARRGALDQRPPRIAGPMAEARRLRRVLSGVAVGAGGVGYEQKLSTKPVEQRPPAAGLHWWSE